MSTIHTPRCLLYNQNVIHPNFKDPAYTGYTPQPDMEITALNTILQPYVTTYRVWIVRSSRSLWTHSLWIHTSTPFLLPSFISVNVYLTLLAADVVKEVSIP